MSFLRAKPRPDKPTPASRENRSQPLANDRVAVRVRNVWKHYERGSTVTRVLKGVNLDVYRGEILFLAGPSGSGKSTLLSVLGCILTPERGQVLVMGQEITTLSEPERVQLRQETIGFVFQRFQLIRGLTALDNVSVPLILAGQSQAAAEKRSFQLLDSVGLAEHCYAIPSNMSAGQCQRVALARALASAPPLILADEPTASLDAKSGREVMELLRQQVKQNRCTAIVVTHDQRIFRYADRVLWVAQGQIHERPPFDPQDGQPAPPSIDVSKSQVSAPTITPQSQAAPSLEPPLGIGTPPSVPSPSPQNTSRLST